MVIFVYFRKIHVRSSLALIAGLTAAAAAFSGCGSGGSEQAPAAPRPKSAPPHFHQASYDVEIFRGWPQDESDTPAGAYLESAWHDPATSAIALQIDSRASDGTGSPIANAELARVQVKRLPGYRERGFKKITVGGHQAIRWAFDLSGKGWVDYFFAECGTSFTVLGESPFPAFASLSESFQEMAGTIKALCSE
jgi:hypothetical protein